MHTSIVTHLNTLYTNKSSMQFINPSPTRSPLYGPTNCVPTCKSPVQILILASVLFELLIYRPLSNIRKATNEPFSERFLLTWVIWNCQISQFKTHFWSMKEEKKGTYTWHVGDSLMSLFLTFLFGFLYFNCHSAIRKPWTENNESESLKTSQIWKNGSWTWTLSLTDS